MGHAAGKNNKDLGALQLMKGLIGTLGSAGRGALSATLGMPGDLEQLGRMIVGNENDTLFPTTETVSAKMPKLPASLSQPVAEELGQWAPLSPSAAKKLAKPATRAVAEAIARGAESNSPLARIALPGTMRTNVVKDRGGNWITDVGQDPRSPRAHLRGFRDFPEHRDEAIMFGGHYADEADTPAMQTRMRQNAALNSFLENKLGRYIERDMGTPGDPIRALAEQGILHFDPHTGTQPNGIGQFMRNMYAGSKVPNEGPDWAQKVQQSLVSRQGQSDLARKWEAAADSSIDAEPISTYLDRDSKFHHLKQPWMEREGLNLDDPIYRLTNHGVSELGFLHLKDELKNALRGEAGGLPPNLRLAPEDLDKMGIDNAVRHVAKINEWRAVQKAEADALKANNAATHLYKEYPENNPRGLHWVELKAPEAGEVIDDGFGNMSAPGYVDLEKALKYEGDTMGHCVGGYCDNVFEGSSRIFSLRDAKGQPHVTIETAPPLPEDIQKLAKKARAEFDATGRTETDRYGFGDWLDDNGYSDLVGMNLANTGERSNIVQIKGKQNRAPNAEYLPFVQDFIKSDNWGDIGDLHNAQMWKHPKTGAYHTIEEAMNNPELGAVYESRNLDANGNYIGRRYAEGGLVENGDDFAYPGFF